MTGGCNDPLVHSAQALAVIAGRATDSRA